ncbi:MAG: RNA polymerase sigma factor [Phycisphaerales bacterium]
MRGAPDKPQSTPGGGEDLLARAIAGQPLALDRLLLEHYARLTSRIDRRLPRSLRRLLSPDDILQEVFADVFRTIGRFRPEGTDSFYRWLVTIADHRVLDAVRSHRAAKRGGGSKLVAPDPAASTIAPLLELLAVSERTPSRSVSGREAAAAVHVALAGLRDEYREALRLRFLEGLPVAGVASRMGKTESAVHKLCARGLQKLREAMGDAARYLSRA